MTNRNIMYALGYIDPKLIANAAPDMPQKKNEKITWIKWVSIAACFLFLLSVTLNTLVYEPIHTHIAYPINGAEALPDGPYVVMSTDWLLYRDAQALVDSADLVFIGKITDIDFQVLDSSNALPVSDKTLEHAKHLYTIYSVEISQTYKGDTTNITKIRIMGGLVDYDTEAQLHAIEEGNAFGKENGIPVWSNSHKIECQMGNSYLFALRQFETGYPTILNLDQSIFDLHEPTKKQTVGNNENVYYSEKKDEYHYPLISVKDIIMEFGKKEWKAFYEKWEQGAYTS